MATDSALFVGVALLVLGGCQEAAEVTVKQQAGLVRFEVVRQGEAAPICIERLSVHLDTEAGPKPVWEITNFDQKPCTSEVELGRLPAGFTLEEPEAPPRLIAGKTYLVGVSGGNWIASKRFTASP